MASEHLRLDLEERFLGSYLAEARSFLIQGSEWRSKVQATRLIAKRLYQLDEEIRNARFAARGHSPQCAIMQPIEELEERPPECSCEFTRAVAGGLGYEILDMISQPAPARPPREKPAETLAEACLAYDAAIQRSARGAVAAGADTSEGCWTEGDDLDELYARWLELAHAEAGR